MKPLEVGDIIKFEDRLFITDSRVCIGKIIKIKPLRSASIYLDNVVELQGTKSYARVFDIEDGTSHRQTNIDSVRVNFGKVTKKDFIEDFPEYAL